MKKDGDKQVGRPTTYRKEYCEALIEHMKQGFSFEAFGALAHVSRRTLQNWVHAFPEFAEAKEIAESYARLAFDQEMTRMIRQGGGNATVWIFAMRNRFGWRNDPVEPTADESEAEEQKIKPTPELMKDLVEIARGRKK